MAFEPGAASSHGPGWTSDLVDVDLHWAAALAAGVLTGGLIVLGTGGSPKSSRMASTRCCRACCSAWWRRRLRARRTILAMMLGDDFTYRALRLDGNDIVFDHDAPIEPEPKPDPQYTPIIGRSAVQLGPDAWRITPPTLGDTWAAGNLAKVDHIVVVMMENRSFDHVLGYRAELAGTARRPTG